MIPRGLRFLSIGSLTLVAASAALAADWPQFRGPGSLGIAAKDARPPIAFGPSSNVLWQVTIPPGNSSPVVRDGRLFLTAFDAGQLWTVSFDAATGRELWRRSLPPSKVEEVHRSLGSPASATVATDASRVFVHFGSFGMAAYTIEGRELWRHPLPVTETEYGASSSPVVAGNLVIQLLDQDAGSYLVALRVEDGTEAWRVERPEMRRGFGTPILWSHHGRTDLVVPGTIFMTGLDPASGRERWRVDGLARITCTTPVVSGNTLYAASWTTGGDRAADRIELGTFATILSDNDKDHDGRLSHAELPAGAAQQRKKHLDGNRDGFVDRTEWESMAAIFARVENQAWALDAAGDGSVTAEGVRWRFKRGLPYVASPLHDGSHLYLVKNGGFLTCLDVATGKPAYQEERLSAPGDYYASPTLAGGHLYLASQPGTVTVVKPGPKFEVVARNDLGEAIQASPAMVGSTLYLRTASKLYAFGAPDRR